jgi:tetratricopeptide (TPR) repeat protein
MVEDEHNRLYLEATAVIKDEMRIDNRQRGPLTSELKARIEGALVRLVRVLELNPGNWAALFFMGKGHQVLEQHEAALDCFSRAYAINQNPDMAREAGISAMECGRTQLGLEYASASVALRPDDPGLRANLGVAMLLNGRAEDAHRELLTALEATPTDSITRGLVRFVEDVCAGKRKCPQTGPALEAALLEGRAG